MKIGLVCPYNLFISGGVQECVLALQKELINRGHDALIITPRPAGHRVAEPKGVLFLGRSRRVKTPQQTSMDISVSIDIDSVDKLLESQKFDLLHVHEPMVPFLPRQIISRVDGPVIATFHAAIPDTGLGKTIANSIGPLIKSMLKHVSYVTAVSPAATGYITDFLPPKNIIIIPNGIDLELYNNQAVKSAQVSKEPTILYIGRLEKRKGVNYLLMAFKLLKTIEPSAKLIIAGDGPDRIKLENWVADNNLKGVYFKGYISDAEKLRLYSKADLFCSPAILGESFGIVLLEAMAMGVVTVAGDNSGYTSVLTGRGELSLVNPKDITSFARQLHLLLNDEDLRKLWLSWAKSYVRQFNYSLIVDKYEQLYNKALKKPRL